MLLATREECEGGEIKQGYSVVCVRYNTYTTQVKKILIKSGLGGEREREREREKGGRDREGGGRERLGGG